MTEGRKMKVDPRFRRISQKKTKVTVDDRFGAMFEDEEFVAPVRMDKYGRVLSKGKEKGDLERFYQLDDQSLAKQAMKTKSNMKGASDLESTSESELESKLAPESELESASESESESESESNSSASSTSESEDEDEDEEDLVMDEALSSHPLVVRDVPFCESTKRLALVNMDWDQIKADDIYMLVNGFKPAIGNVLSVTIYPSQFGKERMAREALEGPPKEIFSKKTTTRSSNEEEDDKEEEGDDEEDKDDGEDDEDDEDDEEEEDDKEEEEEKDLTKFDDEGEDFNSVALRKYQLERLRYYYAVIECDSASTAFHIYKNCDGSEFEKSANFLDLRFIPDNLEFSPEVDGPIKDICKESSRKYYPKASLITSALNSTKVSLTWDADDPERSRITKRGLANYGSKGGNEEEEEADLRAYLATDSESSGGEEEAAERYRSLLLAGKSDDVFGKKENSSTTKDLSITFASALCEQPMEGKDMDSEEHSSFDDDVDKEMVFEEESAEAALSKDPTPFAKYMERRKAKKKAKKEVAKELVASKKQEKAKGRKKLSKEEKANNDLEKDQLSLFISKADATDDEDDTDHRLHGGKRRKSTKSSLAADGEEMVDERFAAIYKEPAFALDPSNPAFTKNKQNDKIIKERQRRLYK